MGTTLSKQGKQNINREVPTFKIVLVGEPGSGKSSVFLRYIKNQYDYSYQPSVSVTIGNVVKNINIPYQGVVSVVLWDIPGREEMDLRKSYYKDVDAAIVVVDVSEVDTIGLAPTWKQDVLNHAQLSSKNTSNKVDNNQDFTSQTIPILLLGNKADKLEIKNDSDTDSESTATKIVKELEETAIKHGFVGSVTVSAKEGDGSVHAAVQILVRYLLQKQMAKKTTQKTIKNIFSPNNETENEVDVFMPFLKVNMNEFDDIFTSCEEPIKTVEKYSQEYFKALRIFKRSCAVADLVSSFKCSLEECITGLKENMMDENNKCGLKAIDDGGFLNLVILDDMIDDIPGQLHKIIRIFHTKVAVAAKDILTKCSVAHGQLKHAESQLYSFTDTFDELAKNSGLSEKLRRKAWVDIQANTTRLTEACGIAMEYLQNVENDCKRIKAAALW